MKIKLFITYVCLLVSFCLLSFAKEKETIRPLSVLVIGGGPAGLAAAIEARASGYRVTVVEKRGAYSRPQWLFLTNSSLKLLEKWKVNPPEMRVADLGGESRMGFVSIKHLEEQLNKRAKELAVKTVYGEFQGFRSDRTAVIMTSESELALPYDVIVGADGAHSNVRDRLGIENRCLGTAVAACAVIPDRSDTSTEIDISPEIKIEDGFLRRIKVPSASIVFVQFPLEASKKRMQRVLEAQGWGREAKGVGESRAFVLAGITVSLCQAQTFSSEQKSAILIGDAAATASFVQGMGANTALKAAVVAGQFFKEMQTCRETAFLNFNQTMKETTDAMIEDSAFLFENGPS